MEKAPKLSDFIAASALLAEENLIGLKNAEQFKKLVVAVIYLLLSTNDKKRALFERKTENNNREYSIHKFSYDPLDVYWQTVVATKKDFKKEVLPALPRFAKTSSIHPHVLGSIRIFLTERGLNDVQDLEDLVRLWECMNANEEDGSLEKEELFHFIQAQGVWRGWGKENFKERTASDRLEYLHEAVNYFREMDEQKKKSQ